MLQVPLEWPGKCDGRISSPGSLVGASCGVRLFNHRTGGGAGKHEAVLAVFAAPQSAPYVPATHGCSSAGPGGLLLCQVQLRCQEAPQVDIMQNTVYNTLDFLIIYL